MKDKDELLIEYGKLLGKEHAICERCQDENITDELDNKLRNDLCYVRGQIAFAQFVLFDKELKR